MSLHAVAGHAEVRRSLARAHLATGLPRAILLHGARGVGKQRLAQWIAQLQVCEAPTESGPCGTCRPCRLALSLEHPDVHWYFPLPRPTGTSGHRLAQALESARIDRLAELRGAPLYDSRGDELRGLYLSMVRGLRAKAHIRPAMSKTQIFIVGEAEYLVPQEASPEAANALLKLLEEPPGGTSFVLTSSEPGRLLPTIRSRTIPVHCAPLSRAELEAFLQEHTGAEAGEVTWAAGLANGSIGRALGFLPDGDEHGHLEALRRRSFRLVQAALAPGPGEGFALSLSYPPAKARTLVELFAAAEEWVRDLAAVAAGAEERVTSQDALAPLRDLVGRSQLHAGDLARAMPALEEARELSRGNVNPQLVVAGVIRRIRSAVRADTDTGMVALR